METEQKQQNFTTSVIESDHLAISKPYKTRLHSGQRKRSTSPADLLMITKDRNGVWKPAVKPLNLKTHKRLKERFLIRQNWTKRASF